MMRIFHSDDTYASVGSLDELRRARRKLNLKIALAEQNLEQRTDHAFSFDGMISSLTARFAVIKNSVTGVVDCYNAVRDCIHKRREQKIAEKQAPDKEHAEKGNIAAEAEQ